VSVRQAVESVLTDPHADHLWTLRAELLEAGLSEESRAWQLIDEYQRFLDCLATSSASREYSELASRLDIGALGGVVLENLLEARGEDMALRLLTGALSEGLMVLATRQHVRAWGGELAAVHRSAAWFLYRELWDWAERRKPGMAPAERRILLDTLFAPLRSADKDETFSESVFVGLIFQVLLVSHLSEPLAQG
jgi:hypothetical protein